MCQGSYGSGKTRNLKNLENGYDFEKVREKVRKTRKMGKSQGKVRENYFASHDQYFSCIKIVISFSQQLGLEKSYLFHPIFLDKGMFFSHNRSGRARENQNEILTEPCVRNASQIIKNGLPALF